MAFSAVTERGSASEKVSDTSLGVSPSAALTVGKIVYLVAVTDNTSIVNGATTDHTSVADTDGHTWTKVYERTATPAGAAEDGVTASLWWTKVTTEIDTGDTVTLTIATARIAKALGLFEVTVGAGNTVALAGSTFLESLATGNPAGLTLSGLASKEYLFLGIAGNESFALIWTEDADYTNVYAVEGFTSTGGGSTNNVGANVGTRIATLTGDTFDVGGLATSDHSMALLAFEEVADGGPATVTPAVVVALIAGPTPTLVAAAAVTPVAVTGTVTGPTASVSAGSNVPPVAVTLTVTSPTPVIRAAAVVTPAAIAASVAVLSPTILTGIAHDAATESHTGTTGWTTTPDPFTFSHTPIGTPRGVLVFTFVNANVAAFTSVSYGGVAMAAVSDGEAIDTTTEAGRTQAWFLGAGIPTGAQTVSIDHTTTADVKYAVAITVTGSGDTFIAGTPVLLQNDGSLTEQAVDSASLTAIRYAAVNSGLAAPPVTGANSTALHSIDFGSRAIAVVRETTAGSGSRSVGFTDSSDDRAAVHLAIAVIAAIPATVTPAVIPLAPTLPLAVASIPATVTGTTIARAVVLPTPTVTAASKVTPATVTSTVALPTAVNPTAVTPTAIPVVSALPAAVASISAFVTGTTIARAATLPTPAVTAASVVIPATIVSTTTLPIAVNPTLGLVTPAVITTTATLPASTVAGSVTVTPATIGGYQDIYGDLYAFAPYATLPTPTILAISRVTPARVITVVALPTPTVVAGVVATGFPAAIPVVAALPTAIVRAAANITPVTIAAVTAAATPSTPVSANEEPATVASTVTLPTPTLTAEAVTTPATTPVTVALPDPVIVTGASAIVTPAVTTATTTLSAPSVLAASTAIPAAVAVVGALPAPTIEEGLASTVIPATITAIAALPNPAAIFGALLVPATIPLTAGLPTPSTPAVPTSGLVTPAVIATSTTLPTPLLLAAVLVSPSTMAVLITVPTPDVQSEALVFPSTIVLLVTFPGPNAIVGALPFVGAFWTRNPLGYARSPVGFVKIGANDDPPWD